MCGSVAAGPRVRGSAVGFHDRPLMFVPNNLVDRTVPEINGYSWLHNRRRQSPHERVIGRPLATVHLVLSIHSGNLGECLPLPR